MISYYSFQIRHKDQSPLPISNHFNSLKKCSLFRSDLSETINSDRAVNITCISLAKNDPEKFVVGTETGGLLICQINSVNWNETYSEYHIITLNNIYRIHLQYTFELEEFIYFVHV